MPFKTLNLQPKQSGHKFSFLFRENIEDIPNYDAVFIRATTDPLFTSYIVSKTAWELGLKVIDDPESIKICGNKIHQYALFEKYDVPRIPTIFLNKDELHHKKITEIFDELGKPVVIKAPYTSFSAAMLRKPRVKPASATSPNASSKNPMS